VTVCLVSLSVLGCFGKDSKLDAWDWEALQFLVVLDSRACLANTVISLLLLMLLNFILSERELYEFALGCPVAFYGSQLLGTSAVRRL